MTRTKKFNRTRFKAETLRAARGSLEKIAKVSKKTYRFEWFAVTKLNGEHWKYDSLEEFLAAYSEEVEWASWTLRLDENKFELEVEVRAADTNISVSAESNGQIDAIINLFIEAQPSSTLEAPASVGDSLLTNEEPPTFKCSKQLPSCHVDRRLVEELETYVLSEASRITCNPIADVKSDYALSIVDQTGNEVVTSAAQLEGQQFHNSTSQITLQIDHYRKSIRFRLTLTFDRRRNRSEIETLVSAVRAREHTYALIEGIFRRLSTRKNFNWLYLSNSEPFASFFFGIGVVLPIFGGIGLITGSVFREANTPVFFAGLCLFLYVLSGVFAKPYASFDTPKQVRLNKWWDWFFFGCLGFLIFGSILPVLRKQFFGF